MSGLGLGCVETLGGFEVMRRSERFAGFLTELADFAGFGRCRLFRRGFGDLSSVPRSFWPNSPLFMPELQPSVGGCR